VFASHTLNYHKAIGGLGLDLNGRRVRDQPTFKHTRLLSTQANIQDLEFAIIFWNDIPLSKK
jgi:hypothetical protein